MCLVHRWQMQTPRCPAHCRAWPPRPRSASSPSCRSLHPTHPRTARLERPADCAPSCSPRRPRTDNHALKGLPGRDAHAGGAVSHSHSAMPRASAARRTLLMLVASLALTSKKSIPCFCARASPSSVGTCTGRTRSVRTEGGGGNVDVWAPLRPAPRVRWQGRPCCRSGTAQCSGVCESAAAPATGPPHAQTSPAS
jgi:hypothetical protein